MSIEELKANKVYLPGEWQAADRDFKKVFSISFSEFYDSKATILFERIMIDSIAFIDYLKEEKKMNEDESVFDCVKRLYGRQGVLMILCLL